MINTVDGGYKKPACKKYSLIVNGAYLGPDCKFFSSFLNLILYEKYNSIIRNFFTSRSAEVENVAMFQSGGVKNVRFGVEIFNFRFILCSHLSIFPVNSLNSHLHTLPYTPY